jgi:hypothetical protein
MTSVGKTITVAAALGLLGWIGCDDGNGSFSSGVGASGGSSVGSGALGAGVGKPCTFDAQCRSGLVCDMATNTCAPGHSTPEGSPCTISAECAMGLYCAAGTCAKAGAGAAGEGCTGDAGCQSGLKCALVGLGAECVPEGGGDVGGACMTGSDCFGGLTCDAGMCAVASPTAPFGPLWPGVTCQDDGTTATAYFRVPRGVDDGDFYRLPFPNDVRLAGGKPNLKDHPTPGAALLGYDLVDRYLRAIENEADGWGLYHTTFFRFSGELELGTLSGNVNLVDLTQKQGMGLYYTYSIGGGAYICPNWIGIRRGQGETYNEGDTYAAYITTGLKAKGGAPIARSPDLDALLLGTAPTDAALLAAYPAYAPLRAYLTSAAIDPATVLTAAVFTVGKPTAPVAKLETVIDAAAPPAVAQWTRCDTGVTSPCPDATGDRACAAADPAFDELHALVTLPIFQDGTAPYLTPADGGGLKRDAAGTPVVARTEDVCLSLSVPKGAPPAGGWPTVVFAHGTGGNFRSHVPYGVAADFAKGVDDGTGKVVKAAVLGIDQVAHGPRRNGSMLSPQDLFSSFANPAAAKGNVQQGAADQMSLRRLVPSVAFAAASSPTNVAFSLGAVAYWGHAQGATEGALALPFGVYGGAVFSGQSASLMDALLTRTGPKNIAAAVPWVLQDAGGNGMLVGGTTHPVLSLLQTYMDGSDPLAYARRAAKAPPAGVAAHHVFQPYGQGDTFAPPVTQATYALAAAFGLVAADPSVKTPDDIGGLSSIPTPASGNMTTGGKTVSALLREYAPDAGKDGNFVAFDLPSARGDAERFLAGVLSGIAPRVGP